MMSSATTAPTSAASIPRIVALNLGWLTPITPVANPESTLTTLFYTGTDNPTNINYYYWVNKDAQK